MRIISQSLAFIVHPYLRRTEFAARIATIAVCLAALGCGKSGPTSTIRGKVTYQGKPIELGSVVFFPETGPVGSGKLGPGGAFVVLNHEESEELAPGKYSVTVIAGLDQINLRPTDASFRVEPTIPLKYTSKGSSPLKYDIKEGPNELDITLDDKPSPRK
jgi:hypothetical protein